MKVALFGGTGFVGSYIVDELLNHKHKPKLLVRENSEKKLLKPDKCEIILGDLNNPNAMKKTIKSADVVIYSIGLVREFPRKGITFQQTQFEGVKQTVDLAKDLDIKRYILVSANGAKLDGTKYQSTKYLAEEYLKHSELEWTIFRPSLCFGDPRGGDRPEFCTQLKRDMLSLPIPSPNFHTGLVPINAGKFALSPVHIKNVAEFVVKSIEMDSAKKKTYPLGGEAYYWKDLIKTMAASYGKKKWMIPAPAFGVKMLAFFFERFAWFPITRDQVTMLVESNACDSQEHFDTFEIERIPYNTETLSYLKD
ncbi:MAG: NAD(P)H-binding protein [Candidatus Neomarinimicrobiota bacterium]|nr:NAD(P)H-binding protein [Candidatus Neomarinimicrobiota bacterium]